MISKKIRQKITKLQEEARGLMKQDANDPKINELSEEVKVLNKALDSALEEEERELNELRNNGIAIKGGKTLKRSAKPTGEFIKPGEKFEDRSRPQEENNLSFAKLVKGMANKGWDGADEERDYLRNMISSTNTVLIPVNLSNGIVDMARETSAILGNITVYPMPSNNTTIAVTEKDATANFVIEGDKIPQSEMAFKEVT